MCLKVGDAVRLKKGWTKMWVVKVTHDMAYATYASGCKSCVNPPMDPNFYDYARHFREFVIWNPNDPEAKVDHSAREHCVCGRDADCSQAIDNAFNKPHAEGESAMVTKKPNDLYETLERKPRYGTFITTNSVGQLVLEMKGEGGRVEAFDEDKIRKVVPYTFEASCATANHRRAHYVGNPGDVKVGDVLVSESGNIYYVRAINTGSESPRKVFRGSKLTAKPVGKNL